MLLLEFDLAGAEWVVVAYASGDAQMIGVAESGKSPHVVTGSLISGVVEEVVIAESKLVGSRTDPDEIARLRADLLLEFEDAAFLPRTMSIRQAGKRSNHGLNYGMRYKRFALENEMPETDARKIVELYSSVAYPGLKDWWKATVDQLRKDRTLTNCFGRKRRFLDQWGSELFDAAYSFVPQSTVFDVCCEGMCRAYEDTSGTFQKADLLCQVHDSLVYQYPRDWSAMATFIERMSHEYLRPELEYGGRKFKLGVDLKAGKSWGEMHEIDTSLDAMGLIEQLKELAA